MPGVEDTVAGCGCFLQLSSRPKNTAVQVLLLAVRRRWRRKGLGSYLMKVNMPEYILYTTFLSFTLKFLSLYLSLSLSLTHSLSLSSSFLLYFILSIILYHLHSPSSLAIYLTTTYILHHSFSFCFPPILILILPSIFLHFPLLLFYPLK